MFAITVEEIELARRMAEMRSQAAWMLFWFVCWVVSVIVGTAVGVHRGQGILACLSCIFLGPFGVLLVLATDARARCPRCLGWLPPGRATVCTHCASPLAWTGRMPYVSQAQSPAIAATLSPKPPPLPRNTGATAARMGRRAGRATAAIGNALCAGCMWIAGALASSPRRLHGVLMHVLGPGNMILVWACEVAVWSAVAAAIVGGILGCVLILTRPVAVRVPDRAAPAEPRPLAPPRSPLAGKTFKARQPPVRPTDLESVAAPEMYRLYSSNEIKADRLYRDKVFAVWGVIESVGRGISDTPYVILTGIDGVFARVQCTFAPEDEPALAKLSRGQVITIAGIGAGKSGHALMRHCWIYAGPVPGP